MKIELCVSTLKGLKAAVDYGVDRIEICQNLEEGGVTPSWGMIRQAKLLGLETHVLIRARPGDFCYSEDEIQVMLSDIAVCRTEQVAGVVIGALTENTTLDIQVMQRFISEAGAMDITFHRAFDELKDWKTALDQLVDLKVNRILTAGLAESVNFKNLKEVLRYTGNRIEIMAGGGVNPQNMEALISLKPNAIHFSGTSNRMQGEGSLFSAEIVELDDIKIKNMMKFLSMER
jgi:copper homeostasis protein